ncbi:uncharacterized protein LOC110834787 isoform X2 [Zootermopsis nevadensis]|uniref:uncharacterized protein LOC110834787 isoform X2 n=1 Tax=Zootermopsis nevadensis TaxID=136037 RepID=UPI000B8ED1FA|nr:uncharacterized protein LOC110834787 isoform X2 [Zootermopsis nevadensis]
MQFRDLCISTGSIGYSYLYRWLRKHIMDNLNKCYFSQNNFPESSLTTFCPLFPPIMICELQAFLVMESCICQYIPYKVTLYDTDRATCHKS